MIEARRLLLRRRSSALSYSQLGHHPLQVPQEQLGQVRPESVAHDDSEHLEVFQVGREAVGGDEPSARPEGLRYVKDRIVLDLILQTESKRRNAAAVGDEIERSQRCDL